MGNKDNVSSATKPPSIEGDITKAVNPVTMVPSKGAEFIHPTMVNTQNGTSSKLFRGNRNPGSGNTIMPLLTMVFTPNAMELIFTVTTFPIRTISRSAPVPGPIISLSSSMNVEVEGIVTVSTDTSL